MRDIGIIDLLVRYDGRVRHAGSADLSIREEVALRLAAEGKAVAEIARWIRVRPPQVPGLIESAAAKLIRWHRDQARDILAVAGNDRMPEYPTYEDPTTGEEVEIRPSKGAGNPPIHATVDPTPDELTAPLAQALSAILQ